MTISSFQGQHRWLSNFWPVHGSTAEHQYQARKTLDPRQRERILNASTPYAAKKMARSIALRPDWNEVRVPLMASVIKWKFTDAALAQKLLATGEQNIVEGNAWGDTFWGVCRGVGENHLGEILMAQREYLRLRS